ncbi:hypothetical protein HZF08_22505 [Paenibacillus sp. CGMCC 1.16610]|uniref:Uncharacterized protein n=1 Tax=Paenibacillus anseongense TaxID=2682845 RepID=A0ABW9UKV1_9BACL|nr:MULTISPECIES: hypothetical protein [Paenibacillus]MBA2941055.1 hypothetical protein [Paenibacillus sp. CGMCC 1.16610]MVQ39875.1 hypothetical protein [Paenibacillus anseongense]
MDLGKITVGLLSKLNLIPSNQCILPNSFYDYGWAEWLPLANITTLPQISYCVSKGLTRDATVEYLHSHNAEQLFINFEEINRNFITDFQRNEFFLIYSREYSIKIKLEENGMFYPSTMEEVIELFLQLGFLLQNINHSGNKTLDLIIRPFPKVSDHFKYT